MQRPTCHPLLTALLALGLVGAAQAQSDGAKAADEAAVFTDPARAAAAADAPAPARPAKPKRDRVMSDDLKATLAVGMPKYNPPKPVEPKPANLPEDVREADKPRNGIIRLPNFIVREARPPVFKEKDITTPSGKADLAMKRNPGLNFGPFSDLNRPIALSMYYDQERQENMQDLADEAKSARRAGDSATADYILKQSNQTYLRRDNQAPTYGLGPR